MSLSSCKQIAFYQLLPEGAKRRHLISFWKGKTQLCWCSSCKEDTKICVLSPSVVNGNKNYGFCHHLCVGGSYKLTGIIGHWREHYFARQRHGVKWIRIRNVSRTWSILGILKTPKKPQSWACFSKIKRFIVFQFRSTTIFVLLWTGHAKGDVWSTCCLI